MKHNIISLFLLVIPVRSFACPAVFGIPDLNCNGRLEIAVAGDSFVVGTGDAKNGNEGGYVLRVSKSLRKYPASVLNLGVKGLHSGVFLRALTKARRDIERSKILKPMIESDVVILDLGRNDRWDFGEPLATMRNLKRIASLVRRLGNPAPLVVTANLMLPNRGSQGGWVKDLNSLILAGHTPETPSDLRFDLVSKRLLSFDQLHPSSEGYAALAKTLLAYLKTKVPDYAEEFRPDSDGDGIYDFFEKSRYLTDPLSPDTDGDGVEDGDEVFVFGSDPRSQETPG